MIGALKQLEAGRKAEDVAREVGVSKHTIYAWKAKYGGMDVSEACKGGPPVLKLLCPEIDNGSLMEGVYRNLPSSGVVIFPLNRKERD